MIIVGDIHGRVSEFIKIANENPNKTVVGLGDMGFEEKYNYFLQNAPKNAYVLMGNHDWYPILQKKKDYIDFDSKNPDPSFQILDNFGNIFDKQWELMNFEKPYAFYIRGAKSRDKNQRTFGIDWFPEEELNWAETNRLLESIINDTEFPEVVISHDCPDFVFEHLPYKPESLTPQILREAFHAMKKQPKFWIFGHHHVDLSLVIGETKFICLPEMKTLDVQKILK